jgi:hypothetical protein
VYGVRLAMLDQHGSVHYASEPGGGATAALALATKRVTEAWARCPMHSMPPLSPLASCWCTNRDKPYLVV